MGSPIGRKRVTTEGNSLDGEQPRHVITTRRGLVAYRT